MQALEKGGARPHNLRRSRSEILGRKGDIIMLTVSSSTHSNTSSSKSGRANLLNVALTCAWDLSASHRGTRFCLQLVVVLLLQDPLQSESPTTMSLSSSTAKLVNFHHLYFGLPSSPRLFLVRTTGTRSRHQFSPPCTLTGLAAHAHGIIDLSTSRFTLDHSPCERQLVIMDLKSLVDKLIL